jgi:hypothetical protein
MSKAVSDYIDEACKAKMLLSFNEQVQEMPTYSFIIPSNRFIRRICAYIRKEEPDTNGCSGLETNYGESEDVIFARDEIKSMFIQRVKELVEKNEELLTNFMLHYNPNDLPTDSQDGGGDPTDELLKASQDAEEAKKQAEEQVEEAKKQAEEQAEEVKKQAEEAKKQAEEQAQALGIPSGLQNKLLSSSEPYKGSVEPDDKQYEDKFKNDEKLQEPIEKMKKLEKSEAEEIVIFLTDYMGDFIKCNKNSHEEIRKLLDLVFKVCMEEFVKKGEEKSNLLSIFENQSKSITAKANDEKISILETNLDDLNEIISNTEDVVCKISTSQKYMYIMDKLYSAYLQKSLVDLTFVNIDNEIEKKLNKLPTFDKHKKILFNGGEFKYKMYTPIDKKQESEDDSEISVPKLDENSDEKENLLEKTITVSKFSKFKGKFIIQEEYYNLLDRFINPLEDKDEDEEEENEEKEETPTTIVDALKGEDIKEGGKKKTKTSRKKNKFNRTKKANK